MRSTHTSSRIKQDSDIPNLRFRRFFLFVLLIFVVFSLFKISFDFDTTRQGAWKTSIAFEVTTITLVLLLIAWLPIIITWFISFSPRLHSSLNWLRAGGVEEIEAGGLRMKLASLASGVTEAALAYENNIVNESPIEAEVLQTGEDVIQLYREAVSSLDTVDGITHNDAIQRIDQLAQVYNEARDKLPYSSERTKLFSKISSTMWSLMPSVDHFDVESRINSGDGGVRLSAYKYLEWKPNKVYIELLVSRAVGVLETPFGQYNALLSLRRATTDDTIGKIERAKILPLLEWAATLPFIGTDRKYLLNNIAAILKSRST